MDVHTECGLSYDCWFWRSPPFGQSLLTMAYGIIWGCAKATDLGRAVATALGDGEWDLRRNALIGVIGSAGLRCKCAWCSKVIPRSIFTGGWILKYACILCNTYVRLCYNIELMFTLITSSIITWFSAKKYANPRPQARENSDYMHVYIMPTFIASVIIIISCSVSLTHWWSDCSFHSSPAISRPLRVRCRQIPVPLAVQSSRSRCSYACCDCVGQGLTARHHPHLDVLTSACCRVGLNGTNASTHVLYTRKQNRRNYVRRVQYIYSPASMLQLS